MIPIRAQFVYDIIHTRKFLRFANKACHKIFGLGIKDTLNSGLIDIEKGRKIWNKLMIII